MRTASSNPLFHLPQDRCPHASCFSFRLASDGVIWFHESFGCQMSTEHLVREFYNQMYRVHTQLDNAYDLGDHLHHLTVHKHLDQDPLIQFREAYRWVDQVGARLVADAGCGYGGFAVFLARQAPTLSVDGYTLSDVQRAVARQALARLHQSKSRALLQSYDRLQRQYDAIVAIESLGHSANGGNASPLGQSPTARRRGRDHR